MLLIYFGRQWEQQYEVCFCVTALDSIFHRSPPDNKYESHCQTTLKFLTLDLSKSFTPYVFRSRTQKIWARLKWGLIFSLAVPKVRVLPPGNASFANIRLITCVGSRHTPEFFSQNFRGCCTFCREFFFFTLFRAIDSEPLFSFWFDRLVVTVQALQSAGTEPV